MRVARIRGARAAARTRRGEPAPQDRDEPYRYLSWHRRLTWRFATAAHRYEGSSSYIRLCHRCMAVMAVQRVTRTERPARGRCTRRRGTPNVSVNRRLNRDSNKSFVTSAGPVPVLLGTNPPNRGHVASSLPIQLVRPVWRRPVRWAIRWWPGYAPTQKFPRLYRSKVVAFAPLRHCGRRFALNRVVGCLPRL